MNHTSGLTGAVISCFNLATRLGEDFEAVFVTREEGPIIERFRESGIKSHIVSEKGFLGLKYIRTFLDILKSEQVDLIHLNTLTPFCKYAGIAGSLKGIPVVWFVRENPLISRSRRLRPWLKRIATKIVFVDKETRRQLLGDTMAHNVKVVYNGVDLEHFKPRSSDFLHQKLDIDKDVRLIGHIALITQRKGLHYLIQALPIIKKRYDRFKLVIVGGYQTTERAYYDTILEQIRALSLENDVHFTGVLSEMSWAINSLDIVVLPSLEERCSRTLLESIACGKPVVATRVGGSPELVEDGKSGFLVDPESPDQIAKAVLKLLEDEGLSQEMGRKGRQKAREVFDIRDNTKNIREIYQEAIEP